VREQLTIDPVLNRLLDTGWPLARLDATLRAILRAAAYEVMFMENVPARVAITEYLDVAHAFFHEQEPKLLNGVLNTLARQRRPDEF
jgi:transcription antitermination protein NusB